MGATWWSRRLDENLFMEITGRFDVGTDLHAPVAARGAVSTPGYSLLDEVAAGDWIVLYSTRASAIVGVSRATGEKYREPTLWAARGTYARKAGVEPQWVPGLFVRLAEYRGLGTPLPLSVIQERAPALLALYDALREKFGDPIYFPWVRYRGSLRTAQSYLARFPPAALEVLPEVRELIREVPAPATLFSDPPTSIGREIAAAAGRPRGTGGQGFSVDQKAKVAVEALAMNAASRHYSQLGVVTDLSRTESYDYAVTIDEIEWHVEVKGTTGPGDAVLLTPNEVGHAQRHPYVALFILSEIELVRTSDDEVSARGGRARILQPWTLDLSDLSAVGFQYAVPT